MNYLGFPVTFGYLEKTTLKGGEAYTHRGIDLGSFTGDALVVAGTQIGLTGATGKAEGPHTHVQAGRDVDAQQTIDPAPYIGKPGKVVKVGEASQWGKFVCIKVGDVYVYYCHLSRIDVNVGQVIGGNEVTITQEAYTDLKNWKAYGMKMQNALHEAGVDGDVDQLIPVLKDLVGWKKDGLFYQNENAELKKQLGGPPKALAPGIYEVK